MKRIKTRLLLRLNRWLTAGEAKVVDLLVWLRQAVATTRATLALWPQKLREGLREGLRVDLRRSLPDLRHRAIATLKQTREEVRLPALIRRVRAARLWAVEHDTVPAETVAQARERWLDRQHRHELHEAERQHRREEHAKFREKKDEEERQTYSVFFE